MFIYVSPPLVCLVIFVLTGKVVFLELAFYLAIIWVIFTNISMWFFKLPVREKIVSQCEVMQTAGVPREKIIAYIKDHFSRHFFGYLMLGPFMIIKENRKKVCPKCFD